ncbi:Wnt-8b-like protein [Sarcoptes scabiei]|uniref:Protein Wnt n=1 Tax=Sarcoptes scabiei TaxID=52283 RepID=A0A132A7D5_SARSC|nr:Wnt-8b-like protein [Sarcoptes scabiei]
MIDSIFKDECARQFAYERWPCPESILPHAYQNNLPINQEIAFVQAIISAGIVHTVTKNCSSGAIDNCRCSKMPSNSIKSSTPSLKTSDDEKASIRSEFRWGGCSDNIDLGYKIAVAYLDDRETGRDFKAKIRLHNHRVGRISVKETMVKKCKCHGVSGSCSMQTCWMKVNEFREVGNYLKKAYRNAVKIEINRPGEQSISNAANWQLVYLQDSPDYCLPVNSALGSNGTLGRKCSMRKGNDVSWEERRSCRQLCKKCGHRVKREKQMITRSCNCKFEFCCEVQCQKCTKEEYSYVCAAK